MTFNRFSTFSLTWIRKDLLKNLNRENENFIAGKIFEVLTGDILKSNEYAVLRNLKALQSSDKSGADGSIDHLLIINDHADTIVECKHSSSVEILNQQLRGVYASLRKHLSSQAKNSDLYEPWKDPHLKTYILCTSLSLNRGQKNQIAKKLQKLFRQVSNQDTSLGHLSTLKIVVHGWNDLSYYFNQSALLRFNWVMPNHGIQPLPVIREQGFKKYLTDIPYFSRNEYKTNSPESKILSEDACIEWLLDSNKVESARVLFIHGEGGIGKTRMMYELALLLEKRDWKSYLVHIPEFQVIESELIPGGNYVLLFDYLENVPNFRTLFDRLTLLEDRRVIIIANGRSSFYRHHRLTLLQDYFIVDISLSNDSRAYYNLVVQKIWAHYGVNLDHGADVIGYRPVFAVFILANIDYYRTHPFRNISDFRTWIYQRIEFAYKGRNDIGFNPDIVAQLFVTLPCDEINSTSVLDFFSKDISALQGDFIDVVESDTSLSNVTIRIVLDAIVDEFLMMYFDNEGALSTQKLKELFVHSIKMNALTSCIRNIERISSAVFKKFSFHQFFESLINGRYDLNSRMKCSLIDTTLLSIEHKVEMLLNYQDIFIDYFASDGFNIIVADAFTKKSKINQNSATELRILFDLWLNIPIKERGVSCWFTLYAVLRHHNDGTGADQVVEYLTHFSNEPQARHVALQAIRCKNAPIWMSEYICHWAMPRITKLYSEQLICHLLKTLPESTVDPLVMTWFKLFFLRLKAGRVFGLWLKLGRPEKPISRLFSIWLSLHDQAEEMGYVYEGALYGNYFIHNIELKIVLWIKRFPSSKLISHVFEAWLDTQQSNSKLEVEIIRLWLERNIKLDRASHVLDSLIKFRTLDEFTNNIFIYWMEETNIRENHHYTLRKWLTLHPNFKVCKPLIYAYKEKFPGIVADELLELFHSKEICQ